MQAQALAAIEGARAEAGRVSAELEALRQQFRAYQAMKAGEVAGLEARLRVALTQPHAFAPCPDPALKRCLAWPVFMSDDTRDTWSVTAFHCDSVIRQAHGQTKEENGCFSL